MAKLWGPSIDARLQLIDALKPLWNPRRQGTRSFRRLEDGEPLTEALLFEAIREGAVPGFGLFARIDIAKLTAGNPFLRQSGPLTP